MEIRTRFFVIGLSLLFLVLVINLVRTRKLKEEFAILWLFTGVMLVLTSLFIDVVDAVSHVLGIEYPPALIFVAALLGITLILMQFSVSLSHYADQIKVLTQESAILRRRLEALQSAAPPDADAASAPAYPPKHEET